MAQVIIVLGGALLVLLLSGKSGVFIRGLTNVGFKNAAKTEEGARAIFKQKREEAGEDYAKINDSYIRSSGALKNSRRKAEEKRDEITDYELRMECSAKNGNFDDVELFAQELDDSKDLLLMYEAEVKELIPIVERAKELNKQAHEKVSELKFKERKVIRELTMNNNIVKMHDGLDDFKNVSSTDKLLSDVNEGLEESREVRYGSVEVRENSADYKMQQAKKRTQSNTSTNLVKELRKKYGAEEDENKDKDKETKVETETLNDEDKL